MRYGGLDTGALVLTNKSELSRRKIAAQTVAETPSTLIPNRLFISRATFSAAAVTRAIDMAGCALNVSANTVKADIASGIDGAKEKLNRLRDHRDILISIKRKASKAPTIRLSPDQFEVIKRYWPVAILPRSV